MPIPISSTKIHRSLGNRSFQEPAIVGDTNKNPEAHHDLRSTPSSIHSMLRNTTETGDIGIFSIKPSRTPDPTVQALETSPNHFLYHELNIPKHQIGQLHDHQTPLLRQWHGDKGRLASLRSYKGVDSSLVSRQQSVSQQSHRVRRQVINANDHDASSAFHSHVGQRPQSPFAYPTRLKRPGYRPSSPAFTDFHSTDVRARFGLDRGTRARTASPLSSYALKRSPFVYRYNLNQFDPSPLSIKGSNETSRPPSRLRQTPISRPSSKAAFESFTYEGHQYRSYGDSWRRSRSRFPSPLFYDYTEAFEEENRYYSTKTSVVPLTEPIIPQEQPSEMFHRLEGNTEALGIGELLDREITSLMPSKTYLQIIENESSSKSAEQNFSEYVPTRTDDIAKEDAEQVCSTVPLEQKFDGHDLTKKMKSTEMKISKTDIGHTFGHHILSSSKSKERDLSGLRANNIAAPPALPYDSRSSTSSSNESSDPFSACEVKTSTPLDTGPTSPSWTIPLLQLGHPELLESKESESKLRASRIQPNNSTEARRFALHAPVAKHPISSPRRRERFSRIFSIDESFGEIADGSASSDDKKRLRALTNPMQDDDAVIRQQSQQQAPHLEGLPGRDKATSLWMHISEHASVFDTSQPNLEFSIISDPESHTDSTTRRQSTSSQSVQKLSPLDQSEAYLSSSHEGVTVEDSLPFSFMPLISNEGTAATSALVGLEDATEPSVSSRSFKLNGESVLPRYKLKMRSGRLSTTSLPGSRSRNLETDSPCAEPHNAVGTPAADPSHPTQKETTLKIPKFKLKVTRASDSSIGTVKTKNEVLAFPLSPKWKLATPSDLFRAGQFGRKGKADNSAKRSSKAELIPIRTRFTEEFESRPSSAPHTNPTPQSPGLRFAEVQSFFSDDSSQMRQKNSLRQRLSQFKAIASRVSSSDEPIGIDQRNTGSALGKSKMSERTNGRASAQTGHSTVGMSHLQYAKWKMREKVKGWWHRGEHKVRDWGGRVKKVSSRSRLRSPDLYGVG